MESNLFDNLNAGETETLPRMIKSYFKGCITYYVCICVPSVLFVCQTKPAIVPTETANYRMLYSYGTVLFLSHVAVYYSRQVVL